MKFQTKPWSCGAAAIRNVLRRFGNDVDESHIMRMSGTTMVDGTNEFGIMDALRSFGYHPSEHSFGKMNDAWPWLMSEIASGAAVIMCTERWLHWVVAVGISGDSVVIIDSSNAKSNKKENGVKIWNKRAAQQLWRNDGRMGGREKRIYAISVRKRG